MFKTGDFDGDGAIDLLIAHSFRDTLTLHFNNGSGSFNRVSQLPTARGLLRLTTGDLDADGDLDVVYSTHTSSGGTSIWNVRTLLNDGTGALQTGTTFAFVADQLTLGDMDSDGDPDLIVTDVAALVLYLNDGTGDFQRGGAYSISSGSDDITTADINGDGDLDVLIPNRFVSWTYVFNNDGTGSPSRHPAGHPVVGGLTQSIAMADVEGDGDLDMLVPWDSNPFGSTSVSLRVNFGNGQFNHGPQPYVTVGSTPRKIAMADVDGDGDLDLLTTHGSGSTGIRPFVSLRLNDGTGPTGVRPGTSPVPGFALVPNPARHTVRLQPTPAGPVCVFDLYGRLVLTAEAAPVSADRALDVVSLPRGIYLVRCGVLTQRLVVE
ncbi:MAG: T9SS type A sorting domain-containing protein [Hymenobacteraceae bacterium]|nr:T9SS type A sorting domain-containing protein [Hymenobacteraceae bacterium]